TLVGLAAANGPGFLASLLALRRAGLAALLLDAQAPETGARRVLRALGAPALLRCPEGWPQGPAGFSLLIPSEPIHTTEPACPIFPTLFPENPGIAVVKLTSGSTGAPRGIAAPAAALLADDD